MPACWPAHPPTTLSLSPPPSLFPDKKFPVEAHFWVDKLFYYIEDKGANFVDFVLHFLDLSEIKTGDLFERFVNLEVSLEVQHKTQNMFTFFTGTN